MTGESFDITMSKHMFFQTIGGEKTLATKFTDMFSTTLVFIVFTPEIIKKHQNQLHRCENNVWLIMNST